MTNKYKPDNWVIIEITVDDETYYKVLAGWSGGYLDGDSWRMNSGIVSVEEDDEYYYFKGFSGSVYKCRKAMETLKLNNGGIANKIEESGSGKVVKYKAILFKYKYETTRRISE